MLVRIICNEWIRVNQEIQVIIEPVYFRKSFLLCRSKHVRIVQRILCGHIDFVRDANGIQVEQGVYGDYINHHFTPVYFGFIKNIPADQEGQSETEHAGEEN